MLYFGFGVFATWLSTHSFDRRFVKQDPDLLRRSEPALGRIIIRLGEVAEPESTSTISPTFSLPDKYRPAAGVDDLPDLHLNRTGYVPHFDKLPLARAHHHPESIRTCDLADTAPTPDLSGVTRSTAT